MGFDKYTTNENNYTHNLKNNYLRFLQIFRITGCNQINDTSVQSK